AMDQAIEHFHVVISITTRMKGVQDIYQPVVQRMALKAKIEIAKTYYEDLEFEKAGRLYKRLLSQQHGESELVAVDRPLVHFAAIDSYFRGENWEKVIEEGLDFLGLHRNHFKAPEIRFRMAKAYLSENKGREAEAAYQFKAIMESTTGFQLEDPMMWQQLKWQIGKEMGRTFTERNQPDLALEVYQGLIDFLPDLGLVDQVDLLYRTATLEESLNAKQKALELYQKIIELTESVGDGDTDSREAKIRQMALWKADLLKWLLQIGEALPAEEITPSE
ncbi:MAG: tetratricopeptide repeat protein, partial [Limisphaerales bacterium]